MKVTTYDRYKRIGEMTWPLHYESDEDSVQWRLRYGNPTKEDLLYAASVMRAYGALVNATQKKRNMVAQALKKVE